MDAIGELGGWIGSAVGPVIGILGGAIGTFVSVKSTKGVRERSFMIKAAIVCWVLVTLFVVGMWLIPGWYKLLLLPPYLVLLIVLIQWSNRTQARIRQEEGSPP